MGVFSNEDKAEDYANKLDKKDGRREHSGSFYSVWEMDLDEEIEHEDWS